MLTRPVTEVLLGEIEALEGIRDSTVIELDPVRRDDIDDIVTLLRQALAVLLRVKREL